MKKIIYVFVTFILFTFCLNVNNIAYSGIIDFYDSEFPDEIIFGFYDEQEDGNDNAETSRDDIEELFDSYGDVDGFNWFIGLKEYQTIDPIDIVFNVENTYDDEGTEYLIAEALLNKTGLTWTDYHVELGVGTGDDFQLLADISALGSGLDFDTPDTEEDFDPFSFYMDRDGEEFFITPIFSSVIHMEDAISWDGGEIEPWDGPEINEDNFDKLPFIAFSLDVPDIYDDDGYQFSFIDDEYEGYQFTLRQYPTVIPEPSSLALLGLGLLGLFRKRKKS